MATWLGLLPEKYMKTNNFEIFERIYSDHNFMTGLGGGGFVQDYPKYGAGKHLQIFVALREPEVCTWVFDAEQFDRAADFISNRLLNDSPWRRRLYRDIAEVTRDYFAAGERFRTLLLQNLSNQKLVAEFRKLYKLQRRHHIMSTVANGVVTDGRGHLSDKIRAAIQNETQLNPDEFDHHWSVLTQVTKMSLRQKKDYEIAKLAAENRDLRAVEVRRRLRQLHKLYCWLDYQYRGPAASLEQFESDFEAARRRNSDLHLPKRLRHVRQKQIKLMRTLHFNRQARFLVSLAQFVIWQKGFRKDVQYHSFYCYEPLFRELARRRKFEDWTITRLLFPWEVEKFIRKGKPSASTLAQRRSLSVLIVRPRRVTIKLGDAARKFWKSLNIPTDFSQSREAKGQCAFAGHVRGIVTIVQIPADMAKMRNGNILLSQATSPDLLPAMKKAAAIVTNTGGLICHAAITSRELKIPCIVGTVNATLIFKDGDLVEVDAGKGIVKILKDIK